MTAQRTSRMDDSYVEEAEKDNGHSVSLKGVEPREPRGPGVKADDAVTRFASCVGVGDGAGDRPVPAQPADALVGLLAVLGITIVLAMRLLGVILASAMLILPGVAGGFWSRRVRAVTAASVLCAMVSVVLGLLLSMWIEVLSTGPVIVLTLCGVLAASYAAHRLRRS